MECPENRRQDQFLSPASAADFFLTRSRRGRTEIFMTTNKKSNRTKKISTIQFQKGATSSPEQEDLVSYLTRKITDDESTSLRELGATVRPQPCPPVD